MGWRADASPVFTRPPGSVAKPRCFEAGCKKVMDELLHPRCVNLRRLQLFAAQISTELSPSLRRGVMTRKKRA